MSGLAATVWSHASARSGLSAIRLSMFGVRCPNQPPTTGRLRSGTRMYRLSGTGIVHPARRFGSIAYTRCITGG